MRFLQLLLGTDNRLRPRLIAWLLVASLGTMAAVAMISGMVGQGVGQAVRFQQLVLFLGTAALIVFSQYMALNLTAEVVERTLERLQREMAGLFRRADLQAVEDVGTARIYGTMSRIMTVLGEAGPAVINGLITVGIMVCLAAYVLYLSPFAFVVMILLAAGTVYVFRYYMSPAERERQAARESEQHYLKLFVQMLDGFKEIKLNGDVGDDLQHGYMEAAGTESRLKKRAATRIMSRAYSTGYAGFYLLLAAVVFALPQYFTDPEASTKITYVTIFLLATVNAMMRALPMLGRANAALAEIDELELQLASYGADEAVGDQVLARRFESIRLQGVAHGPGPARVGPFDLELRPGEQVLVTGPNGSGKTTLLRLLTALYTPDDGSIEWDGEPLGQEALPSYRSLFAAVFSDCHVFDRDYGMDHDTAAALPATLRSLGLTEQQSTQPLGELASGSSVLRRRVALAIALLDKRPVLVLDDILAGQDDAFRDRFVSVVLPGLRAAGTCVVITAPNADVPDACVDRVIRLDGTHPSFAQHREATP